MVIGTVAILLRLYSAFPEGTSFAVLIGNTFACLIDELTGMRKKEVAS
jgi:Na+-transporting NADH:ubiquinone oxidoreductase subunit B